LWFYGNKDLYCGEVVLVMARSLDKGELSVLFLPDFELFSVILEADDFVADIIPYTRLKST
jgi:hypothetical protein